MIGRIVFGLIWFAVFYFGACAITGAIVGGMAANRTKGDPSAVAAHAASRTVLSLRGYFAVGAGLLAAAGTCAGILPGTRPSERG
jgi:hypothetical protein